MKDLEALHQTLLITMDEFHSFCELYNLEYFLLGGSLIGAVRHQGFIPWDDDFDIAMSRSDYKKLFSIKDRLFQNLQLEEFSFDESKKVALPFAKLSNTSMYVQEDRAKSKTVAVWIDIFPLDYTFKNKLFRQLQFKAIRLLRLILSVKYQAFNISNKSRATVIMANCLTVLLKIIPGRMLTQLLYFVSVYLGSRFSNKETIANYSGAWQEKEVADASIMDCRKEYIFEKRKYWAFCDADAWLKQVYGDYMQLPPEEKRIPRHIL